MGPAEVPAVNTPIYLALFAAVLPGARARVAAWVVRSAATDQAPAHRPRLEAALAPAAAGPAGRIAQRSR